MFQEAIAHVTRDKLKADLSTYLAYEQALHTDKLVLQMPVQLDVSSLIGGLVGVEPKTLPQYAINCTDKSLGTELDVWEFIYDGVISFLVSAPNPDDTDRLAKRHAAAIERWVRNHRTLHNPSTTDFSILEFAWVETAFMGVAELPAGDDGHPSWMAGASLSVSWRVSESGYDQHG